MHWTLHNSPKYQLHYLSAFLLALSMLCLKPTIQGAFVEGVSPSSTPSWYLSFMSGIMRNPSYVLGCNQKDVCLRSSSSVGVWGLTQLLIAHTRTPSPLPLCKLGPNTYTLANFCSALLTHVIYQAFISSSIVLVLTLIYFLAIRFSSHPLMSYQ